MTTNNKIIKIDDVGSKDFTDVVLCYGHFNLTHPGHLRYLQQAKSLVKNLVVAIISDNSLDQDSFGQHFSELERAESIANLEIVNHVVILNSTGLIGLIKILKPNFLILGKEFEKQKDEEILLAIKTANKSGKVIFHAGETSYATTYLLHDNVTNIESNNISKLKSICKNNKIMSSGLLNLIDDFANINLLVIGDTIVDNYVACDAVGMSAEAPVLVVKELENREFIGGASIVASHVKALGANCNYISVVGNDSSANKVEEVLRNRGIKTTLIKDSSRPTTYKTRYMVENQKLFRVSKIKEHTISKTVEDKLISCIRDQASEVDGILVSDFVYGVITDNVIKEIHEVCKQFNLKLFGDLQCSSQVGKVTKFNNFDLITPTEKEARIALNDNENGIEWIANQIIQETKSKNMLIKLGASGFIAYSGVNLGAKQNFPTLTPNPVDVTGAGDSLFAAMSVALSSGASLIEASVIGTCMASLAVQEVGNVPITIEKLGNCISRVLTN
jgi:rfaE bifunctional protein kinase chain/domain